ncbi:DUF1501 domain-containing protein [Haliscomenobacter sp.]|uniref:DUF1501 domain-containing protein n=1 Tax=Haliscomenobacter sp. TaxID=2717303 RepID=UPI003BAB9582
MKRRNFIKTAGVAATVPMVLNGMKISAAPMSPLFSSVDPYSDKVLVIVRLSGGYDGLNVVLPLDQYSNLSKLRTNILIPDTKAIKISTETGLHPAMTGFQQLFQDGKLSVVHSVGYPNQNRSHFRSTDIWQSASSANEYVNTGWVGRYLQDDHPTYPEGYPNGEFPDPFAITLGSTVSETCQGTVGNFSLTLTDPFNFGKLTEGKETLFPETPYGQELSFLRTSISQTNQYADVIGAASKKGKNLATYPTSNLASQLKNVALLLSGGIKTRVFVANLGGFDTHANQVDASDTTRGTQRELLLILSEAIKAFQEDLRLMKIEERVLGLTFSEFGRQIKSNFSMGTDHGTAAPLFVFGSCVGKQIVGKNPEIPATVPDQTGVPMQIDFRDVYGSILQDWFGVSEAEIKDYLFANYTRLPIVKNCAVATDTEDLSFEATSVKAYPNPFREMSRISFRLNGSAWTRISVFDNIGSELKVLMNQQLGAGDHQLDFQGEQWPAGIYFCRIQVGREVQTLRMVKI